MSRNECRSLAWFAVTAFVALFGVGEFIGWVRAAGTNDGVVRGAGCSLARWSRP